MIIGVVRELRPDEHRVALTPAAVEGLVQQGSRVAIEAGAGEAAGFTDDAYQRAGAMLEAKRSAVFERAELLCQVRTYGAAQDHCEFDLDLINERHILVGHCEPLSDAKTIKRLAKTGATSFALELIPRITRAQSMDVLSSQANLSGYCAVTLAADRLGKVFPMMMTAAGTIKPARVFIVGAGVAGLQAIATARRLGAVVTAYDVRPVVKEQVESLGANFLEIELDTASAEDKGGYAKAMADDAIRRQQEQMGAAVAEADVVITTAAVPGRAAPVLVTGEMIAGMKPGSIIVDLAAERGGNCEGCKADKEVDVNGVLILGPTNLPARVAQDASLMYARNVVTFLKTLLDEHSHAQVESDDEIISQTLLTYRGEIVHARVRELFGLKPREVVAAATAATGASAASAQEEANE